MSKKSKNTSGENKEEKKKIYGDPEYRAKDDIYSRAKKEEFEEGEEVSEEEKKIRGAYNDDDLDIPGAELDDADENIGEEDEENNYYSLGGDRHEDLEEDKED